MAIIKNTEWYDRLVFDVKQLAVKGVVATKHAIGTRILKDEARLGKAEYGGRRIETLAKDLDVSHRDLYLCVQFVRKYPELRNALRNLSWRAIVKLLPDKQKKAVTTPSLPKGKYNVIYADPPWQYHVGEQHAEAGTIQETTLSTHYASMSLKAICELPVCGITADNAVLFLWVTSPLLEECFVVIKAWGFQYKASFVWDKIKHNVGHYNSVRHEFLLICTKGSFMPQNKKLYDSVVSIERTRHSEKPEKFRKIIDDLYPSGKKVDLFARKKTKGWKPYGNDIGV